MKDIIDELASRDVSLVEKFTEAIHRAVENVKAFINKVIAEYLTERGMHEEALTMRKELGAEFDKFVKAYDAFVADAMAKNQALMDKGVKTVTNENGTVLKYRERSFSEQYDPETATLKEQIINAQETLNKRKVVASANYGKQQFKNKADAKKWVQETLSKWGGQVDRQNFGTIFFSKTDIDYAIEHISDPYQQTALGLLPYVLKRGDIIGEHNSHKLRGKHTVTIGAPIEINGTRGNMGVVVNMNGQHVYSARVLLPNGSAFVFSSEIEKTSQGMHQGVLKNESLADTTSEVSDDIISPLPENVNTHNKINLTSSKRQRESAQEDSLVETFVREANKLAEEGTAKNSDRDILTSEDFLYKTLVAKPNMSITIVDDTLSSNRAEIVRKAKKNVALIGEQHEDGSVSVFVDDIGTNVIVTTDSIRHSMDRRFKLIAPAVAKVGEILKNSIRLNELISRGDNIKQTYVLFGVGKNVKNEPYIVSFVVNSYTQNIVGMDVMYSANAKKESAVLNAPRLMGNPNVFTDSTVSVADFLEYVKKYFPDSLPEDVLKHFGYSERPKGKIGDSALFQDRDLPTARSLLANALDSIAETDVDKGTLAKYRKMIDHVDKLSDELDEAKREYHDMMFAKGKRDTKRKEQLEKVIKSKTKTIEYWDKSLLRLEATKPFKDIVEREKQKAVKKQKEKGKETMTDYRESVVTMLDQSKVSKRKFKISGISETHKNTIESIMREIIPDFSADGYELWIDGTGAKHINTRHGANGKADHTMASREDKALIPWAANAPDGGEFIRDENGRLKLSNRYFNDDGTKAPQIRLHKNVGGDTVYVSECVLDSKNKRIYITSAYKKSSTNQLLNIDSKEPSQPTPEATFDSGATDDIISPLPENVNTDINEHNSDFRYQDRDIPTYSYEALAKKPDIKIHQLKKVSANEATAYKENTDLFAKQMRKIVSQKRKQEEHTYINLCTLQRLK